MIVLHLQARPSELDESAWRVEVRGNNANLSMAVAPLLLARPGSALGVATGVAVFAVML